MVIKVSIKKLFIFCPLVLFSFVGYAQSSVILDSLKHLYHKASKDSTKILLLAEIANQYNNLYEDEPANYQKALNYSIKGYYWAKLINFQKGEFRNALQIFISKWKTENDTVNLESKFNKIIEKSEKADDIKNELNCYNAYICYLHFKNDSINAGKLYEKAIELALKRDESYAPELMLTYAYALMDFGNNNLSERISKQAININQKFHSYINSLVLSMNYIQYSTILKYKDNLKALTYMLKADEIDEKLKDAVLLNLNNYLIRELYNVIGDYENSLKYTLLYIKSIKDTTTENYIGEIMSLGWVQYLTKDYKNGLKNSLKAKLLYENYNSTNWIDQYNYAICLSNLGIIYLKLNKFSDALNCALESEKYISNIKGINEELRTGLSNQNFLVIASVNNNLGKINLSIIYAYLSLDRTFKQSDKTILPDIYLLLYNNYKKLNNFPKALEWFEKATQIKDSINEIEKANHIKGILAELQARKKDAEILLASKERKIAVEKGRVQQLYTILFASGFVLVLMLSIISIRSYRFQKKSNKILSIQKKHITERNEELSQLNEEIASQRDLLFQQKKSITDSIEYAKFIQQALLTSHEILDNCHLQNFILFKPRDIISGDFYWFKQIKNFLYFTAADCTGHGVPGAFMSVLGISLLNEIVSRRDLNPPYVVLNELRKRIKKSLKQDNPHTISQDGMDIALCLFDIETNILQFAGAFNPLFIIRNNELIEIQSDHMPVGVHPKDKNEFRNQQIQLLENDVLYIFSDGYITQFGGESGKKFGYNRQ
jgi:serine phosphatase RsbU (regulator of sigma subunit)